MTLLEERILLGLLDATRPTMASNYLKESTPRILFHQSPIHARGTFGSMLPPHKNKGPMIDRPPFSASATLLSCRQDQNHPSIGIDWPDALLSTPRILGAVHITSDTVKTFEEDLPTILRPPSSSP